MLHPLANKLLQHVFCQILLRVRVRDFLALNCYLICTHLHPPQPVSVPMPHSETNFVVTNNETEMHIVIYQVYSKGDLAMKCPPNRNEHASQKQKTCKPPSQHTKLLAEKKQKHEH